MSASKILLVCLFVVGAGLLAYRAYQFHSERVAILRDYRALEERVQKLQVENEGLRHDLEYYANSDNLLKDARAQLNYHFPDEKVIIVVPKD